MKKAIWLALGAVTAGCVAWVGIEYHRQSICAGLETDYLNAVGKMKLAAQTKPLAQRFGSTGEAHEIAIKANSDAMTYYMRQIDDQCGSQAGDAAERKGIEMVF